MVDMALVRSGTAAGQIVAFVCLAFLAAQSLASEPFVGQPVSKVVQMLGTDLASGMIITEPPAVARGIEFRPRNGVEVQVFIKRGEVPLTFKGGDKLILYKDLKVIGFRRVENGRVDCEGEVLWHFSCQKAE